MFRLSYEDPVYDGEVAAYWRVRALEAEHILAQFMPSPFYIGQLVQRRGFPTWGTGVVSGVFTDPMTCRVRWLRSHEEFEVTSDIPWKEIKQSNESGLDLRVPALYEC